MKADDLLFISVGGAAATIARSIAVNSRRDLSQPPMRVLILDTDDAVLQNLTHADGVSVTIFGTKRLFGRGTGGEHIMGASAFRDDAAVLLQQIGAPRLVVVLTCCGGGTSGACASLLQLLRERGIANVVFATEPFPFEGDVRKKNAATVLSSLSVTANALATIPLPSLLPPNADALPAADAFAYVTERLAAGISLFWTLLVHPGYIQFDVENIRQMLEQPGESSLPFTYSDASATGETRAEQIVEQLIESPRFKMNGVNTLANARQVIVGVLAGDDLRLCELEVLMTGIKKALHKQTVVQLGTVNHASFNGKMEVVVMAFPQQGQEGSGRDGGLLPPRKRGGKGTRGKGLSAVKDRFDDVERTIIGGIDYDEPTYLRLNIKLKR